MKRIKIILMLLVVSGFITTQVHAAKAFEGKIGWVDLGRLFNEYEETKLYDDQLAKESKEFEDARQAKIDEIRDGQNKLALLKEDEKKKLQEDLDKQRAQLVEYDRQKRTDLLKKRDTSVREVLLKIEKVVADFAKKEGYTIVTNDRAIVYASPDLNITDPVLKILNENYSKTKK